MTVAEQTLEIRVGELASTVPLFKEGTVQTSAEIQLARIKYQSLREEIFYTANYGLYDLEKDSAVGVHDADGEAVLYFGGRENNPIFSNLAEACRQLIQDEKYVPSAEDTASAKSSALRVKLADLNLQRLDDEWSYYEINTSDYSSLNSAQRALAEKVHGEGQQFIDVMNMLSKAEISTTIIYVLNPKYVNKHAKEQAVCRASWLVNFGGDSSFDADDCDVDGNFSVRGVLRDSAEGGTKKSEGVVQSNPAADAYKTLLGNQTQAVEAMTPEIRVGLQAIIESYDKSNH